MPLTYWGMRSSQGKLQWVFVFGKPRLSSLTHCKPQVLGFWRIMKRQEQLLESSLFTRLSRLTR